MRRTSSRCVQNLLLQMLCPGLTVEENARMLVGLAFESEGNRLLPSLCRPYNLQVMTDRYGQQV